MTVSSYFSASFSSARQWIGRTTALLGVTGAGLWALPAMALPQGGQVQAGQAQITQTNSTRLDIQQSSDRAVIDWNSFSIDAPETVNFQQPSATSATLNRVTGNFSSEIAGNITANGQVLLVNPNGILFTPTATVNAGSFLATTLEISNQDFMNNRLAFFQSPGQSLKTVENQGLITVKEGGFAALVAPGVANKGIINARLGQAVLASGTQATLDFYGDGLVSVAVDPNLTGQIIGSDGQAVSSLLSNSGTIQADGGWVSLTAQTGSQVVDNVINTDGVVLARTLENREGKIILSGGDQGAVKASGLLNVAGEQSGEAGGTVSISGDTVQLPAGQIDISGQNGGGQLTVFAKDLSLGTTVNASGGNGSGGYVLFDPTDFTVDAAEATSIVTALAGGGTVDVEASNSITVDAEIDSSAQRNSATLNFKDENADGDLTINLNEQIVVNRRQTLIGEGSIVNVASTGIVQNGVDVAASGATVNLASGTFTEIGTGSQIQGGSGAQVVSINKDLTIRGNGSDNTIISARRGRRGPTRRRVFSIFDGTVTLEGLTITDGRTRGLFPSGAGIRVAADATVTVANSVITGNSATGRDSSGGGITNNGGNVIVTNSEISDNNARYGGGINNNGGTVTITNSEISSNDAQYGGGIHNYAGTVTITDSTISGNFATAGGGIANTVYGEDEADPDTINSTVIVSNSQITGNSGFYAGGGIVNDGGTVTITNNSAIANNLSDGGEGGEDGEGGGIANFDGILSVTDSSITGNTANEDGGGIFNAYGTVTVTNSTLSNNLAGNDGGGLSNTSGTVTIADSTITENTAEDDGGGFHNESDDFDGVLTISNSEISDNIAEDNGGGIDNQGTLEITNSSTISGNTTEENGGGINNRFYGTVAVTDSTITNNEADGAGGGIASEGGTVTVTNSSITGNTAMVGGGLSTTTGEVREFGDRPGPILERRGDTTDSVLEVANSTISGNTATLSGGGIFNYGSPLYLGRPDGGGPDAISTVTITDSTIAGNSVDTDGGFGFFGPFGSGGGGVYTFGGSTTVTTSTIADNSALFGGGLFNLLGEAEVNSSVISGNTALVGGGIFNFYGGTLTVDSSMITHNSAESVEFDGPGPGTGVGGGIINVGQATISNSTISNNTTDGDAGGILNAGGGGPFGDAGLVLVNSTVSGNSANEDGGGIVSYGSAEITNSTITNNTADADNDGTGNGGGIFSEGGEGGEGDGNDIQDSIVAGNFDTPGGSADSPDVFGEFNDLGNNLIGISNGSTSFTTSILVGTAAAPIDPLLAPLGDYGGSLAGDPDTATTVQTHALLPGSVAIDAGNSDLTIDQRGVARPQGDASDIGAYESAGFSLTPIAGNNQNTTVNTAFGTDLQVQLTETAFNKALPGASIAFTPTAGSNGASVQESTRSITTDANGIATLDVTANTISGSHDVTASTGTGTSANFNLTNNPDAPHSLTIIGGNNQQAIVNRAFGDSLDIEVRDQFGNLVPNANVTFTPNAGSNGASIQAMARTLTTNDLGIVTFSATANTVSGDHQVRATLGALDPANFILSNLADAPFRILATGGTPQMRTINMAFDALQVRVEDQFGNPVPNALITFTVPTAGPSGQVTNLPITTDWNGNASAQFTGNNFAGSFEVQATTGELVPAIFELTTTPIEEGTNEAANVEDQTKKVEQKSTIRPLICVDKDLIGESGAPSSGCAAGFQAQ